MFDIRPASHQELELYAGPDLAELRRGGALRGSQGHWDNAWPPGPLGRPGGQDARADLD